MPLMLRPYSPHLPMHNWMRSVVNLGEDGALHRAFAAYLSDSFQAGKIGYPHGR